MPGDCWLAGHGSVFVGELQRSIRQQPMSISRCIAQFAFFLLLRASQVELVADSLEGMEELVKALGKSKSKSKRDDVKLHANLAEVRPGTHAERLRRRVHTFGR